VILDFQLRSDEEQLRHANDSNIARTEVARKTILDEHGVRYSVMNKVPGWMPIRRAPIDFMHNFYGYLSTLLHLDLH
jgi:acyl-CoA thioesterase FadM